MTYVISQDRAAEGRVYLLSMDGVRATWGARASALILRNYALAREIAYGLEASVREAS